MENIQKSSWQGGEFSSVPSPPGFLSSRAVAAGWIWAYLSSRSGLCLCKSWLWREGTWDRGSHSAAFRGTLPLSWGLIRWAHTQHVPLVSSAWLTLPPEIKARWGAAVLMGRPVCACVCANMCVCWGVVLQEGGREGVGEELGLDCGERGKGGAVSSSPSTSPALGHWPRCKIHIKNSSPVKMTP